MVVNRSVMPNINLVSYWYQFRTWWPNVCEFATAVYAVLMRELRTPQFEFNRVCVTLVGGLFPLPCM